MSVLRFRTIRFSPDPNSNRPRWLYSVGKKEEARKILAKYHSATNDLHSPIVDLEMSEIEEKIEVDGQDSEYVLP